VGTRNIETGCGKIGKATCDLNVFEKVSESVFETVFSYWP